MRAPGEDQHASELLLLVKKKELHIIEHLFFNRRGKVSIMSHPDLTANAGAGFTLSLLFRTVQLEHRPTA